MRHDVLLINRDLDSFAKPDWTDDSIGARTQDLLQRIVDIWPVPPGHKSTPARSIEVTGRSVDLADLLTAGVLAVGQTLIPRTLKFRESSARILSDGRIDLNGHIFETPSGAAHAVRGTATNGWWFWFVEGQDRKSLNRIRRSYLEQISQQTDSGELDDEDEQP